MLTDGIRTGRNLIHHEPEPEVESRPVDRRENPAADDDGVDPPGAAVNPGLFGPAPRTEAPASTLLSEDAGDKQVNCLDKAVDHVNGLSPAERKQAELVILEDGRPGAEGRTGHVVVRHGDAIVDPTSGKRYASTEEYLKENPHYREAGTIGAEQTKQIFDLPAGSAERARALQQADVPPALGNLLLADDPYDPSGDREYIDGKLSYGVLDWAVKDYEARDVKNRLISVVDKQDVNILFEGLSDKNLERLAGNLDEGGKKELLAKLATELSGANAAKLAKHFGYEEVARAVADNAPAKLKADFVTALAGSISAEGEERHNHPRVGGTTVETDRNGNAQARAAGLVLGSLADKAEGNPTDKAEFDRAIKGLAQANELEDVVKVAFQERLSVSTQNVGHGDVSMTDVKTDRSFRPDPLLKLLNGAAESDDPEVKLAVLNSVGKQMKALDLDAGGYQKLGAVGTAMAKLLTEGPHTGALLTRMQGEKGTDPGGVALSEMFKTLMINGDEKTGRAVAEAVKEKGSSGNVGYLLGGLLVATEDLKGLIDDQKKLENYGLAGGAIVSGARSFWVGAIVSAGVAIFSAEHNTGADAKADLDLLRKQIREGVKPLVEDGDFDRNANLVLQLNGYERLVP
jgi:hypothetical protein